MRFKMSNRVSKMCTLVPSLAVLMLTACGGGGDGHTGLTAKIQTPVPPASYSLALRPLPAIYTSSATKAINYSAYRTAGGPNQSEIPTDAQILQDLTLLNSAGYTLLRLFDTDISHENILRVAQANFPQIKFHLGIYLQGIAPGNQASCTMPANDADVNNGIREANTYPNVVTVSVGNETSFFAPYMPVHCLAGYITTVKQQVQQPITADDDYTFYAGQSGATELPDTVLPLLDFASIHTYPMSNSGRWASTGTGSAANMMNLAFLNAQSTYTQVANYISTHGAAANLPIIVGETGWKAVRTNTASALETCCANPINAKMYFDAMNSWQTGATGPKIVFYFEAFDEVWKATDDGWGIWDTSRTSRYALCGSSATNAPACTVPPYLNATFQ